jgi:tryptophanyl-tRNA synthetase
MGTPLGWLERMPTYKDQIEKLKDRDLATYGFLGYPLLQAADILIYRAAFVPVGEDQSSHVEITREVARRFNHLYGREPNFEALAEATVKKMGKSDAKTFEAARKAFRQDGDASAHAAALALIEGSAALSAADRERLTGYFRGTGRTILTEPQALHTEVKKLPGLDGAKMSKSYGNAIAMRDEPKVVEQKIRRMQTDPKRVRRTDPGNPEGLPGVAVPPRLQRRADARVGRQGLHHRRHRLPRVQAAGHRGNPARAAAMARARRAVPVEPQAGPLDRRGRHRARAHGSRARPCATCAPAMGLSY